MKTEFIKIDESSKEPALFKASQVIRSGGLVVFPTETVYGLGANALDEEAVKKIFLAKGRPSDNPIIIHIYSREQLFELTENISLIQEKLMEAFWPGPLTIIFKKKDTVSSVLSGGLDTVAVRMPANPFARELLRLGDVPIAAPSANISGKPSATLGSHALSDLDGRVDMVLDLGPSDIGVESTVVKVEGDRVLILRPGIITEEIIAMVSGISVSLPDDPKDLKASPGTRYRHYAPKAKMQILNPIEMTSQSEKLEKEGKRVGILCTTKNKINFKKNKNVFVLGDREDLDQISRNLYSGLRFFDDLDVDVILCESFPKEGLGVAVMNRLEKASSGK